MPLEDHLIGFARKLREMGESLVETATKVAEEVTRDKPTTPEGATAKPEQSGAPSSAGDGMKVEDPGWVTDKIINLPPYELFSFAGEIFQVTKGSVRVRDEKGVLTIAVCARYVQGDAGRFVYFHPQCVVFAPKK